MLAAILSSLNRRKPLPDKSEAAGARTLDLRIKSPLLYRLSYSLDCVILGVFWCAPLVCRASRYSRHPLCDTSNDARSPLVLMPASRLTPVRRLSTRVGDVTSTAMSKMMPCRILLGPGSPTRTSPSFLLRPAGGPKRFAASGSASATTSSPLESSRRRPRDTAGSKIQRAGQPRAANCQAGASDDWRSSVLSLMLDGCESSCGGCRTGRFETIANRCRHADH